MAQTANEYTDLNACLRESLDHIDCLNGPTAALVREYLELSRRALTMDEQETLGAPGRRLVTRQQEIETILGSQHRAASAHDALAMLVLLQFLASLQWEDNCYRSWFTKTLRTLMAAPQARPPIIAA